MIQNTTTHVSFIPEPNCGRGTIGILWQCFTTIFLCVYTCLHLNVPPRPLSKSRSFLRSLSWVVIGLLLPEVVWYKALLEWLTARRMAQSVKDQNLGILSTKQAHFLLWGGLCFQHGDKLLKSHEIGEWITKDGTKDEKYEQISKWILSNVPTDAEIDDRSKADLLAKALASMQVLWVAVQGITRLQQNLEISLLEVVTIAYIVVSLFAYGFWASKPYGISISEHISIPPEFELIVNDVNPTLHQKSWMIFDFGFFDLDDPNDNIVSWGTMLLAAAFGGVHCAAWDYSFPTLTEALMWRVSAIFLMSFPMALASCAEVGERTGITTGKQIFGFDLMSALASPLLVLYIAGRLFLWVETFISFRSAPEGIYRQTTWPSYLGHIGS